MLDGPSWASCATVDGYRLDLLLDALEGGSNYQCAPRQRPGQAAGSRRRSTRTQSSECLPRGAWTAGLPPTSKGYW